MKVIRIEDCPNLFQRSGDPIVKIWSGVVDIGKVWDIESSLLVIFHLCSDIYDLMVGVKGWRMATDAPLFRRDFPSIISLGSLKQALSAPLGRSQRSPQRAVTIGRPGNCCNVSLQCGQFLLSERLNPGKEHCQSRSALTAQRGVCPLPLERSCVQYSSQTSIVDRAYANAVRLNIEGKPVDMPIGMTGVT